MAEPYRGILGPILGQVEAIKSARSNRAMDELQAKYLESNFQAQQQHRTQQTQAAALQAARDRTVNRMSAAVQSGRALEAAPRLLGDPQTQEALKLLGVDGTAYLNTQGMSEPDAIANLQENIRALGGEIAGPEAYTLGPGQVRMEGTRQVAAAPFAPEKPPTQEPFSLSPGQVRFDQAGRQIAAVPVAPGTGPGFEQAAKLRAEFNTQSSEFRGATQGYQNVLSASANPSAAGDIALIFSFMRTLDPNSTVREGEFATAESAGSVPSRIWGQYNRVLKGERLAPEQRQDFISQATELYRGQLASNKRLVNKYTQLATSAGVNPGDVIGESLGIDIAARGAAPPPAAGELPRIQTDDEFNALPPGPFIAPDGTTRMKY